MGKLTLDDKKAIVAQLFSLEEQFGPAPLRNVEPQDLSPEEVDVIAVGSVVTCSDGSTVLVRREETPTEWLIPGGTVDPGEGLLDASVREVREETGLTTEVRALLRIGFARNYGPKAFQQVNLNRFGKKSINLLFVNFHAVALAGVLDGSADPSANILEVKAFKDVPFQEITHVYKVLFVQQGMHPADLAKYPAVEFSPGEVYS